MTAKFNIQLKNGVAYVFAKTVDTEIPATGETVKGDPQPADLEEYSTRKLDATNGYPDASTRTCSARNTRWSCRTRSPRSRTARS